MPDAALNNAAVLALIGVLDVVAEAMTSAEDATDRKALAKFVEGVSRALKEFDAERPALEVTRQGERLRADELSIVVLREAIRETLQAHHRLRKERPDISWRDTVSQVMVDAAIVLREAPSETMRAAITTVVESKPSSRAFATVADEVVAKVANVHGGRLTKLIRAANQPENTAVIDAARRRLQRRRPTISATGEFEQVETLCRVLLRWIDSLPHQFGAAFTSRMQIGAWIKRHSSLVPEEREEVSRDFERCRADGMTILEAIRSESAARSTILAEYKGSARADAEVAMIRAAIEVYAS